MALSIANVTVLERGRMTMVYGEVTGSSAYVVGGETLNASDLGLVTMKMCIVQSGTSGYRATYIRTDDTKGKLSVYATASATTSAGTPVELSVRDLSAVTFYVFAIGLT